MPEKCQFPSVNAIQQSIGCFMLSCSKMLLFVRCSVQLTHNSRLQLHNSRDASLFLSLCFTTQHSEQYAATRKTNVFKSRFFVFKEMDLFFHVCDKAITAFLAMLILFLISFESSYAVVVVAPR